MHLFLNTLLSKCRIDVISKYSFIESHNAEKYVINVNGNK